MPNQPLVAIDYTPAVRQSAGIGRLVRGQVQALLALDPAFEIRLFVVGTLTPDERAEVRASTGLEPHTTPLSERNMVRLWHRLGSPIPTIDSLLGGFGGARPDLLHATDFVLPPNRARRTLLTVHDLAFLFYPEAAMPGLQRYLNVVVPRSVARASHLLADSHNTARDLTQQWQIPPERITVVQGGVDHERFQPVRDRNALARVRARYIAPAADSAPNTASNSTSDAPYIFAVSRLEPRKNFVRLIEAFAIARSQHNLPHKLIIGGKKGWLYDEIFARVRQLDLQNDVLLPGFIDDADLPALFSGADFFAYPSLYEGFGLPIIEALACGVPVLTADNSCLPEAGGDGALYANALDVDDIAAKLAQLATDPALRARLAEAGLRHAATFTWQRSARQLLGAYTAQLASAHAPH